MPRQISEARTCKEMIDPQLEQARLHSWMVVLARVESLRGRMGESTRQVEGLFDALLAQTMDNGR